MDKPTLRLLLLVVPVALVVAAPAARAESYPTVPYRLVAGSTYQEGCFENCDCPIIEEQAMTGGFDLVFYPFAGPLWTVAVEHVDWSVPTLGKELTGQGIYRRGGDMQQLWLDLQIDGAPAVTFDSGWVPGGDSYPFIDVTLSMHGLYCWDIALHVRAKPVLETPYLAVDDAQLSWSELPDVASYDVLCGDLMGLRAHDGEFGAAIDACMADDLAAHTLAQDVEVAAGAAVWFLIRPQGGSWDSGGVSQAGSRDASIAASTLACP
jgi:hypothetical protein